MKKFLALMALALASAVSAQFNISGTIKSYEQKPILVKVYENGTDRLVKRIETDHNGKFIVNFPTPYTGKVIFELSQGGFEVISVNEDIKFNTDLKDPNHRINYEEGINKQIAEVFELDNKKSLRDYTLVELLKLYNPQDDFYKAVQKEIQRIDDLKSPDIKNEAIEYYIETKNEIGEINAGTYTAAQIIERATNHLVNDNINLENFGLLQDFLTTYISYSISTAKDKDDAANKMEIALDKLLSEANTDTSRGQAILTNIIPMLEGNGFKELSIKYLEQATSLTCEITPGLESVIQGKNNIAIGKVAPNIVFDKKIKNAKSLYDVKADQKLVIFWASWCPHCARELDHIKSFYPDFHEKGGEIIAFSLDLEEEPYLNAIKNTGWINYSDFMKWQSPMVNAYGITGTPTMILLDKDNKILKIGSRISEFL